MKKQISRSASTLRKKESSPDERSSAAVDLGKKGGKTIVRNKGVEYMREIGREGAKKRWSKDK